MKHGIFLKISSLALSIAMALGVGVVAANMDTMTATKADEITMNIYGTTGNLSSDSSSISWTSGDFTVTNHKGSTAIRTSDSDHFRLYANSTLEVSYSAGEISKMEVTCITSGYASVFANAYTTDASTSLSGSIVTVTFNPAILEYTSAKFTAQTRISKIVFTYSSGGSTPEPDPEEPTTYTITYETNGGTLPDGYEETEKIEKGGEPYTLPIPTRDGFTFDGWYEDSNFTGNSITSVDGTKDVIVYAKWTEIPIEPDPNKVGWYIVQNVNELKIGDQIIIAAKGANVALSTTQNTNNRGAVAITKGEDNKTVTFGDDVQKLTLEAGTQTDTYAFNTGSGYLYAASSTSNNLKTKDTLDDNGSWNISINAEGVATVKAQGTYTRNWLRYNSTSTLFSCYGSGQSDVNVYKYFEVTLTAQDVIDQINEIGTVELTSDCKIKIENARSSYESLSDEEKAKVTNIAILEAAEEEYARLEAEAQVEADKAAAAEVDALILAIGEVTSYDQKASVDAARTAYDALTDTQKGYVVNLAILEAAEAKIEELKPLMAEYIFTDKEFAYIDNSYGGTWEVDDADDVYGFDNSNNRGVQIGAAKGQGTLSLSGANFANYAITSIKMIVSTNASDGTNSLSLSVNGTAFKCGDNETYSMTKANNYEIEFMGYSLGGDVVISYNDAVSSIYFKSISIYLQKMSDKEVVQLSAQDIELSVGDEDILPTVTDGTNPISDYTLTSNNTSVVTIVDGKVHAVTVGTAQISVTKAETDDIVYIQTTFTVDVVYKATTKTVTLEELLEEENNTNTLYTVTGIIKTFGYKENQMGDNISNALKYGNFILTDIDRQNEIIVYGSSTTQTGMNFDKTTNEYSYNNPQDFLTSGLEINDEVTMNVIRCDYNGTLEVTGIISNVVKAAESFVNNFMHMNDDEFMHENGTDGCDDAYARAKVAFGYLTQSQINTLITEHADAFLRLQRWAAANGETINDDGSISSARNNFLGISNNETSVMLIVVMSSISLLSFSCFLFLRKRKEQQ